MKEKIPIISTDLDDYLIIYYGTILLNSFHLVVFSVFP